MRRICTVPVPYTSIGILQKGNQFSNESDYEQFEKEVRKAKSLKL